MQWPHPRDLFTPSAVAMGMAGGSLEEGGRQEALLLGLKFYISDLGGWHLQVPGGGFQAMPCSQALDFCPLCGLLP